MVREAVYHQMDSSYAFLIDLETLVIRLRVKKNDIKRCILHYGDRCDICQQPKIQSLEMKKKATDALFDYYEVEFEPGWNRIFYYFLLDDGKEQLYYFNDNFYSEANKPRTLYYQYAYFREKDVVETPDWIRDAVMYQIFPDSFATDKAYLSSQSDQYISANGFKSRSHLGGTLKGIQQNLDYIQELGINCIYMTPIFHSNSYHKYDIIDYYEIDPLLGTKEDFKELVEACHHRDIRIILDGVFNHTSTDFFAFHDLLEKGEDSIYKDWYMVHHYPVEVNHPPNYEAFAYVESMPRTNTANEDLIDYFIKVGEYWIKEFNIDGWRLDVANEIDHDFWRAFRKAMKKLNKDIFIVGEIWEDAYSFLGGDQFDSVMNYPFMYNCEEFFAKENLSVSQFDEKMAHLRMRYKRTIQQCMMNFLDCHDVKRFMHSCQEDSNKFKMAAAFQLTYLGVPSIFYGDELGFTGLEEPEYRRKMEWSHQQEEHDILTSYKRLIKLRHSLAPLRRGDLATEFVDDDSGIYAFSRNIENHKVLVIMNGALKEQSCQFTVHNWNRLEQVYGESAYEVTEEQLICHLHAKDVMIFDIEES
ncbi:glycoside hydrolase family 13 protein [Vallitalea okinawensis]|uniref:glycoside hydrolase family 13 protein n=1 Tax=Vallitalea okinawensis TaxID=2078660 RepID=UPI000CFC81CA|nr:glycoside hydrolase family 13 protein [Vallitalea okinawensis]